MSYQHFIAALVVAFLLFIGTITAQKAKENPILPTFEQLVANDAPQAYQLAINNKLNFEQLEFFILYELEKKRNFDYIDTLYTTYWEQLTHEDKLKFKHIHFLAEYAHLIQGEYEPYQFSTSFAYVVQHQTEYKKAWGDSLYNRFILDYLGVDCIKINLHPYAPKLKPIDNRKQKAETFLSMIKANLPDYEPHVRAYVYCYCVYNRNVEKQAYYDALNNYLTKYETEPEQLIIYADELIEADIELKYKKMGLNWIDKALKLDNDIAFIICKAELLYQLGKISKARKTLSTAQPQIDEEEEWIKTRYQKVEKLINSAK